MSRRDSDLLIADILEAVERIQSYTQGLTVEDFLADSKTSDAVVRNLEVIGEAVKQLPEDCSRVSVFHSKFHIHNSPLPRSRFPPFSAFHHFLSPPNILTSKLSFTLPSSRVSP